MTTAVAYRVEPGPVAGREEAIWGGALFCPHKDKEVAPGLSILEMEDGTRIVDVDPRSVDDGDPRSSTFGGVGGSGRRIA